MCNTTYKTYENINMYIYIHIKSHKSPFPIPKTPSQEYAGKYAGQYVPGSVPGSKSEHSKAADVMVLAAEACRKMEGLTARNGGNLPKTHRKMGRNENRWEPINIKEIWFQIQVDAVWQVMVFDGYQMMGWKTTYPLMIINDQFRVAKSKNISCWWVWYNKHGEIIRKDGYCKIAVRRWNDSSYITPSGWP